MARQNPTTMKIRPAVSACPLEAVRPRANGIVAGQDIAKRERGETTMGGTIALEKRTNVFLRVDEPGVLSALEREAAPPDLEPASVFGALRRWKDRF